MSIHARHQFKRNRFSLRVGPRHTKAGGNHRDIDRNRPPEGTVLPLTGMVVGPDPSTRAGMSDIGRPLAARKPWLFDGTWRTPVQRRRDELREHKRTVRSMNKGRLVAADLF